MVIRNPDFFDYLAGTSCTVAFMAFVVSALLARSFLDYEKMSALQKAGELRSYYAIYPPEKALLTNWVFLVTIRKYALYTWVISLILMIVRSLS